MLEQFSVRGVNLSRIESRPIGDALGRYAFSMDAEGHVAEERLQAVLIGLHRVCPVVRFIGSYPSADGRRPTLQSGTTDNDFRNAREWVSSILQQGGEPLPLKPVPFQQAAETVQSALLPDFENMDSKVRIRVAALSEFSQYGYDGASMRRVAGTAHVDPGLIPYHFGGKANLFRAAVVEALPSQEEFARLLDNHTVESITTILEALASPTSTGVRAAVVGLVRTALSPSAGGESVQSEIAGWNLQLVRETVRLSTDPIATDSLIRLLTGLVILRDVVPITPLRQLGYTELARLVAARLALVDRSVPLGDPADQDDPGAVPGSYTRTEPEPVDPNLPARDRILAASRQYFARWGYNMASLRDIAKAAGCDISLVHYYFGSKTGLMQAVVKEVVGSSLEWNALYRDGSGIVDPQEALIAMNNLLTAPGGRENIRALLISAANPGSPRVSELVREHVQSMFDLSIQSNPDPEIALGFHILAAEVIGCTVLAESQHTMAPPEIPNAQTRALARTLLVASRDGVSLEQLASDALGVPSVPSP